MARTRAATYEDQRALILARAAVPAGAQSAIPEVLVRRFDVIGPDAAVPVTARAFWMHHEGRSGRSSMIRTCSSGAFRDAKVWRKSRIRS